MKREQYREQNVEKIGDKREMPCKRIINTMYTSQYCQFYVRIVSYRTNQTSEYVRSRARSSEWTDQTPAICAGQKRFKPNQGKKTGRKTKRKIKRVVVTEFERIRMELLYEIPVWLICDRRGWRQHLFVTSVWCTTVRMYIWVCIIHRALWYFASSTWKSFPLSSSLPVCACVYVYHLAIVCRLWILLHQHLSYVYILRTVIYGSFLFGLNVYGEAVVSASSKSSENQHSVISIPL